MERDHISFHYDRSTKGLHPSGGQQVEQNYYLNRLAVTSATYVQKSTSGFEGVFALVGLIAVFCLVRFSRS